MKLKLDAEGHAVIEDGKPVYIGDDGAETAVDVAKLSEDVATANGQARDRRHELKAAEDKLKLYGDLDPSQARQAVAFKKALGDIDPSKVEHEMAELKAANAGLTTQVEELNGKLETADSTIDNLSLGAQISGSDFIRSKVVDALQEPELFRAAYGKHFSIEKDGKVLVKDQAGNTIMSEKNAGQPASLDEALPKIVTNKKHLREQGANGSGQKTTTTTTTTATTSKVSEMDTTQKAKAISDYVAANPGVDPNEAARAVLSAG